MFKYTLGRTLVKTSYKLLRGTHRQLFRHQPNKPLELTVYIFVITHIHQALCSCKKDQAITLAFKISHGVLNHVNHQLVTDVIHQLDWVVETRGHHMGMVHARPRVAIKSHNVQESGVRATRAELHFSVKCRRHFEWGPIHGSDTFLGCWVFLKTYLSLQSPDVKRI